MDVPASAEDVLQRILREQERWDEDLLESRIVETLDHNTEVYQYVRNSMPPHPPRDHVVLRSLETLLKVFRFSQKMLFGIFVIQRVFIVMFQVVDDRFAQGSVYFSECVSGSRERSSAGCPCQCSDISLLY